MTLAALLSGRVPPPAGKTVCLLSGGNIDMQTLDRVVERGMMAEGRFLRLRVELLDDPGSLARLTALVAGAGANILHVSHDRHSTDLALGRAVVRLELETRGPEHIRQVLEQLESAGCGARLLR